MPLISSGKSRFNRTLDYSLAEFRPTIRKSTKRLTVVTPETHNQPRENKLGRQEERR